MKLPITILSIVAIGFTANAAITKRLGIIQGTTILPHWAPYMVFLSRNADLNSRCGGSLITENYVLTAANCLQNVTTVKVVLGADNVTFAEDTQVSYDVTPDQFTIHEDFNSTSLENDIALIKLPTPAPLNDYIQTVPVARAADVIDIMGQEVVALGWGTQSADSAVYSDVPYAIWINVTSNTDGECNQVFGDKIKSTNMCCTHDNNWDGPMLNICDGDFGGPLVRYYKILVGIASFTSYPCYGQPNVFTDVTKYTEWLLQNSDLTEDNWYINKIY